jgi:hypothetical protein
VQSPRPVHSIPPSETGFHQSSLQKITQTIPDKQLAFLLYGPKKIPKNAAMVILRILPPAPHPLLCVRKRRI